MTANQPYARTAHRGARRGQPGARPPHLRLSSLAVVFVGGTVGVAAREALTLIYPTQDGIPWTMLCINVGGSLLLGVLLDALARGGPDHGRRRALRLLLGTGLMGGFTSYSALAADTAGLLGSGALGEGIGYGLGTVLLGAVATWAGILLGALAHRAPREVAR